MLATKMMHLLSTAWEQPDTLEPGWKELKGDDDLKRSCLENTFRVILTKQVLSPEQLANPNLSACRSLVELSVHAARSRLVAPTLPHILMTDVFDLLTLAAAETLFSLVEDNIAVWKEKVFFEAGRNTILRICNDLLRRLSRTQNTLFCGRILLFLAKFFPITERSALNVVSEFNLDNVTAFEDEEEMDTDGDREAITIEENQRNLNIDYSLYKKFWPLQDFFRNPTQCYNSDKWKSFSSDATDVLNTFQSFKLDSLSGKKKRHSDMDAEDDSSSNKQYFAKYLTNQNLLHLQLSDSNFRRYILVQFLILFQYLQSAVKFKSDSDVLSEDQKKWISSTTGQIFDLMKETPPNGSEFVASVKHLLNREERWIIWKNEGCHGFKSDTPKDAIEEQGNSAVTKEAAEAASKLKAMLPGTSRKAKRKIKAATAAKKFLMGNPVLTRLWNRCPDNMEACAAPQRDFLPDLAAYFHEAIEQINPENGVEAEYMKINDGAWGWRALRLMAKKSPHFFTYGNNPIGKLPDYLENMLWKMCKDANTFADNEEVAKAASEACAALSRKPDQALSSSTNKSNNGDSSTSSMPDLVTSEEADQLGKNIAEQWNKLVSKLGIDKDVQEEIDKNHQSDADKASALLKKWVGMEKEAASKEELLYILEGQKMKELADGILYNKQ